MTEESDDLECDGQQYAGRQVRFWRKHVRGMTLQQVADKIGASHGALAKLEKGTSGMSLERLEMVARALNVPISVLIDKTAGYAGMFGRLTGVGRWIDENPVTEVENIYPVLLPRALPFPGPVAFEDTEGGIVFCKSHMESREPANGRQYVVARMKHDENGGHYEMALRTFRQSKPTPPKPNLLSEHNRITGEIGHFYADDENLDDWRLFREDESIQAHWQVIARFSLTA